MSEKPSVDIRRFAPKKMSAKYWVKILLYSLILGALIFWYKQKSKDNPEIKKGIEQKEINLKGVKIEDSELTND